DWAIRLLFLRWALLGSPTRAPGHANQAPGSWSEPHQRLGGRARARVCCGSDMDAPGPLLDVHPVAIELGERFTTAGFRLFLVGGAVRDTLLGRSGGTNLDFSTDAKPAEKITVLRGWAQNHYLQG